MKVVLSTTVVLVNMTIGVLYSSAEGNVSAIVQCFKIENVLTKLTIWIESKFSILTNWSQSMETWQSNNATYFEVIIKYHFFKKGHNITTVVMVIMKIGVLYSSAQGNISAIIQCFIIKNVLIRLNFFELILNFQFWQID